MSMSPSRISRFRRPRRRPGQALVEVGLLLPLVVGLAFLTLAIWLQFTRVSAYTRSASTLAEWVARAGEYDPEIMCPAIRQTLVDQVGAGVIIDCSGEGATNTFVQVVVLDPACIAGDCAGDHAPVVIGGPYTGVANPAEADCSGAAACPTNGIGWNGTIASGEVRLASGSRVVVDIWGSRRSGGIIFMNNSDLWTLPVGHAAGYVTADGGL